MFAHGDRRAGCTAGRFSIHSAMASFMREASVRPPGEALAGPEGRQGRGQPWSSHWQRKPSQAGPKGRAGLPHCLAAIRGHLGCRPAPGCRCRQQVFFSCLLGCTFPGNPADAVPPYKPHTSLGRQVPARCCQDPLAPGGSSGHKGSSVHPVLPHPWVSRSLAQVLD